ncbi:hypothetical protein VB779_13320 [Haloarculaceae archaeon H-GB11]|nr:hypothetical protein [Haloarculaceae archaeon H-GB11]
MSDGDDPTDRDDGHDLVVTGGTVVSPEQGTFRADIAAADGVISRIAAPGSLDGDIVVDARGRHVLPGVVDPHVHHGLFRPLADDADTESRSGLVGGVTTTGNIFRRGEPYGDIMAEYRDAAERNYRHDYFFTLGLLYDEHVAEVPDIVSELGITSFKWYGNYKLQTADRFGLDRNLLDDVADGFIQELSALDAPTTLAYHAENAEITERLTRELKAAGREDYDAIVEKFPGYAEAQAAVAGSTLARQHDYDDDFYVVHVSAKETAQNLAELQSLGYGVTAETCTHYLALTAEECDQRMRINPPVRSQADQDAIWTHLREGTIDCVGTDHIANTRAEKAGEDIWDGLWGSPSSATLLPSFSRRASPRAASRWSGPPPSRARTTRRRTTSTRRRGHPRRQRRRPRRRRPRRDEDRDARPAPERRGLLDVRGSRSDRVAHPDRRPRRTRLRRRRGARRPGVRHPRRPTRGDLSGELARRAFLPPERLCPCSWTTRHIEVSQRWIVHSPQYSSASVPSALASPSPH